MKIVVDSEPYYIGIIKESSFSSYSIEAGDMKMENKRDRYIYCYVNKDDLNEKDEIKNNEIIIFQIDDNDAYKAVNIKKIKDKSIIVKSIIDQLSLNCATAHGTPWYYTPHISDRYCEQLIANCDIDLFPILSKRILSIEPSVDNINFIVFLFELMKVNMPNSYDYYELKDWNERFSENLAQFCKDIKDNPLLNIILWATHVSTKSSFSALRTYFTYFPPYLQIRCVRKLFQLISLGKLKGYGAEKLYKLLSNDGANKICLPLEITFEYLKRHENDSSFSLSLNDIYRIICGRDDYSEWEKICLLVNECKGRWFVKELPDDKTNPFRNSYYNGSIYYQNNQFIVSLPRNMMGMGNCLSHYNNKYFYKVQEYIRITYNCDEYVEKNTEIGKEYCFDKSHEIDLFSIARTFNFKYYNLDNFHKFDYCDSGNLICECRASDCLDNFYNLPFNWCENKPCFCELARFHINSEWESYTILDFMRILNIPTDYTNHSGKKLRFGHYTILSSCLNNFEDFYEHLICRKCGKLLKPAGISNFAYRAITEFSCDNDECEEKGNIVYINHCFNKFSCNSIIDSRDSKTCPNGQYICPTCGACCSTENFRLRYEHLIQTGEHVSKWLKDFVDKEQGHWEKQEFFCYKCGKKMTDKRCNECEVKY